MKNPYEAPQDAFSMLRILINPIRKMNMIPLSTKYLERINPGTVLRPLAT